MIRSMTGFGRESYTDETISIELEIKTVNSRFLDISIRMPNQFNFLEDSIRKTIKNYIHRGRVELFIRSSKKNLLKSDIIVDLEAAKQMKSNLQNIIEYTGIKSDINLSDILKNEDVLSYQAPEVEDEYLKNIVITCLENTLESLDDMRSKEGKNLSGVILSYIDEIEQNISKISSLSGDLTTEYRNKLTESINKLLDGNNLIDENRLANEIVFYADKVDIQEEINRMTSHIKLFRESMNMKGSIGKKLDFINQEMLRETNTIGSKANKEEIINIIIEQKTIIEKIKEQVQNIE